MWENCDKQIFRCLELCGKYFQKVQWLEIFLHDTFWLSLSRGKETNKDVGKGPLNLTQSLTAWLHEPLLGEESLPG